jgi:hypothetical protein
MVAHVVPKQQGAFASGASPARTAAASGKIADAMNSPTSARLIFVISPFSFPADTAVFVERSGPAPDYHQYGPPPSSATVVFFSSMRLLMRST